MRLTLPTRQFGFTLIELMIVLLISAIVLAWGVPSFQTAIRNNRLTAETNRVIADLQLARSEAIKRGMWAAVCRTQAVTLNTSSPTCQTNTSQYQYELGWIVFATTSDTGTAYNSSKSTLLRVGEPASTGITIRSNGMGDNATRIKPNGALDETGDAYFTICYNGASTNSIPGRRVEISLTGRTKVCLDPNVTASNSSLPKCATTPAFRCTGG